MSLTTLKDYKIKEEKIDNKIVRCVFIFDDYSERKFNEDFEEWVTYQKKQNFEENKEDREKNLDFKFYRIKNFTPISYELFRHYSLEFFSKVFFQIIKNNPSLITSDEFNIQMRLQRVEGKAWYFENSNEEDFNMSSIFEDAENACFNGAGIWFLQTIVAPFHYFKKIDFTIITRYFIHEMTHHFDRMNKYNVFEQKHELKIKQLYKKNSAYFLNCLYTSLFNLREEGLADFNARKNSNRIDVNMNGIKIYNANLLKLSQLRHKKDAESFYDKELGYMNLTPSNEYTMGRNMCLFITMYLAKQSKKPYSITVNGTKFTNYEFKDLNSWLSKYEILYVSDISKEIMETAINMINPTAHHIFVNLYEQAAKNLGISEENMIMTKRRFYNIVIPAMRKLKEEKIKRLADAGFMYVEQDIKEM